MVDSSARFANYLDAPTRLPLPLWFVLRACVLLGFAGIVIGGITVPSTTLTLFWGVLIPVLPAVWMLAPGLWRNTCPLATANQLPRLLGFSREQSTPVWLQRFAFSIAMATFIVLVLGRKVIFNTSGIATSVLLVTVLSLAFVGGVLFKGKSGWCSAVCPLLPIQRLYGQAPAMRVANAHCETCVGCAKNCFDFNPGVAYVADMHDNDEQHRGQRSLFAGAFPGLVVAFFSVGTADDIGIARTYATSMAWILGGVAIYRLSHVYLARRRQNSLAPLFAATGFVLFYWYSGPRIVQALDDLGAGDWGALSWAIRGAALVVAGHFLWQSRVTESRYLSEVAVSMTAKAVVPIEVLSSTTGEAAVKFVEDQSVHPADGKASLLEIIEAAGLRIEVGCRMGVCGADPIAVVAGSAGLSAALPSELTTLSRLGLGPPNRMACVAKVIGACTVSLMPDTASEPIVEKQTFPSDPSVRRVVVIGNGIAGVTAADFVRRNHPDCRIDVVGREAHHLYNRMGISKLIYSPRGVASLSLLDQSWYERNRIESWLNTTVRWIDLAEQRIDLGTGERLDWDRLILAMGSTARIPEIDGFDQPGCFVVRSADHAVRIRRFAQRHDARNAFVAGGGLLGLEAAFSLHRLGLHVTVGERSARLMRRQVNERGSEILRQFFESVGIRILLSTEIAAASGTQRIRSVTTTSGEQLATDLFVVAAGITPNVGLAKNAGLDVARGVTVDEHMRTSHHNVFAVGDVAEHRGHLWGLWAVAVEQAEIAGKNAAGGDEVHFAAIPTTILKGAGIDLTSFGVIDPEPDDRVVVDVDSVADWAYARTVFRGDDVIGGVYINRTEHAVEAQQRYVEFHHRVTRRLHL